MSEKWLVKREIIVHSHPIPMDVDRNNEGDGVVVDIDDIFPFEKRHHLIRGVKIKFDSSNIINCRYTFYKKMYSLRSQALLSEISTRALPLYSMNPEYDTSTNHISPNTYTDAFCYLYFDRILLRFYPYSTNLTATINDFKITYMFNEILAANRIIISGGYVDYKSNHPLNVSVETLEIEKIKEPYSISSGTLKYRLKGETLENAILFNGSIAVIPANTLENNKVYEIKVEAVLDDGQISISDAWTEIVTKEELSTAIAISPNNEVLYGSQKFSWQYFNATGTTQKAVDIQVSVNNGEWKTIINHLETSETSYDFNFLEAGDIKWRVRVYNTNDLPGAWSEPKRFINHTSPKTPVLIQIINSGRPLIKWNSSEQIAFEIQVNNEKSMIYYSQAKEFQLNYLANGIHIIKLRIYNVYGKFSDWVEIQYTQNMNVIEPAVQIVQEEGYFKISVENLNVFSKVYLLKDGKMIHKFESEEYIDYFVNGTQTYIIRGVLSDDNFSDSFHQVNYKCVKSALITLDKKIMYISDSFDEQPVISKSKSKDVILNKYLNKEKPIAIFNNHNNLSWSITCKNDEIQNYLDKILFYRNYSGDKAFVIINNISYSHKYYGSLANLTLTEVDYDEGIEYDL